MDFTKAENQPKIGTRVEVWAESEYAGPSFGMHFDGCTFIGTDVAKGTFARKGVLVWKLLYSDGNTRRIYADRIGSWREVGVFQYA